VLAQQIADENARIQVRQRHHRLTTSERNRLYRALSVSHQGGGAQGVTDIAKDLVAEAIGGVAVIRVGVPTEAEMKSKKEALDDAISSTKAAVAEGIVPGGALALLRCIEGVHQEETKCDGDERTGIQILKRALEIPTRQIAENSAVDGGVVVARMVAGQGNYGFDAARKRAIITYACGRN
jgi:chaperonin GroEL